MIFVKPELGELSKEQISQLYRSMETFVKAGGVVTATEWMQMSATERAILIEISKGGPEREEQILEEIVDRIQRAVAPTAKEAEATK